MNKQAEKHLRRAEGFLERGDDFYGKAADEIIAAQEADSTLGNREIGERFGKSRDWVRLLVAWRTTGDHDRTPFAVKGNLSEDRRVLGHAKTVLASAPLEQVERIVSELPRERQLAIGAAAGDAYLGKRQKHDEQERDLTPLQRKEREAAVGAVTDVANQAVAGFAALGVVGHLNQATDDLKELNADQSLTPTLVKQIEKALRAFQTELEVAQMMVSV